MVIGQPFSSSASWAVGSEGPDPGRYRKPSNAE